MIDMKILTYVKSGILLLMIALSSPLLAGQKAELACVSSKQETFKGQATFTCDTYELRVNISSVRLTY
jgi:hypothetical protein